MSSQSRNVKPDFSVTKTCVADRTVKIKISIDGGYTWEIRETQLCSFGESTYDVNLIAFNSKRVIIVFIP